MSLFKIEGKNLLPEGVNSFPYSMEKLLLPHKVTSLECYFFITHVCNCIMGATPMLSAVAECRVLALKFGSPTRILI